MQQMITNTRSGIQHGNQAVLQIGLMAPNELRFIDHFVKNPNTNRINWYRLFAATVPFLQAKSLPGKYPQMWFMMNMDLKWEGVDTNNRSEATPIRNSNPSRFYTYLNGDGCNMAFVRGTFIPMNNVPRPSWGKEADMRKAIAEQYLGMEMAIRSHARNSDAYLKELNKCAIISAQILSQHGENLEQNVVFYIEDSALCTVKGPDGYSSNAKDPYLDNNNLLSNQDAPMTWAPMISTASCFFHVNRGATGLTLANGQELEFGMREVGKTDASKRYQAALYGTTYDRRGQILPVRVSLTNVNTIAFDNKAAQQAAQPEPGADENVDEIHVIPQRGNRAKIFHDFLMEKSPYCEIKNAQVRIRSVADDSGNSSQVQVEYIITNDTEWYLVADNSITSKLNSEGGSITKLLDMSKIKAMAAEVAATAEQADVKVPEEGKVDLQIGAKLTETAPTAGAGSGPLVGKGKETGKGGGQKPLKPGAQTGKGTNW